VSFLRAEGVARRVMGDHAGRLPATLEFNGTTLCLIDRLSKHDQLGGDTRPPSGLAVHIHYPLAIIGNCAFEAVIFVRPPLGFFDLFGIFELANCSPLLFSCRSWLPFLAFLVFLNPKSTPGIPVPRHGEFSLAPCPLP